jgi:14-3-3 protein epsilon
MILRFVYYPIIGGEPSRKELLFLAKTAESAKRYEDMTKFMNKLVLLIAPDADLNVEERNLLSVAYENVVGARLASWRTLNLDEYKTHDQVKVFRVQVEQELTNICNEVLALLDKQLVPAAAKIENLEAQVFYLKMAGDYYTYFAEFQPDHSHSLNALSNYERAYKLATEGRSCFVGLGLAPTHPIRLRLALNFSVCHYEILKNPKEACKLAKTAIKAFDDEVKAIGDEFYRLFWRMGKSELIIQLLRYNLTLWTQDSQDQGGDE